MDVHRQLMPLSAGEIRLPFRADAAKVTRAVFDLRPAAFFRLNPPRHHVVVSGWRRTFPIEEVVAVFRRLGHIQIKRHVGIGSFLNGDLRPADLHAQLLRVEHVGFVNSELSGVLALLNNVRNHLDIRRRRILAARSGLAPLTQIARLETGFEYDLGRGRSYRADLPLKVLLALAFHLEQCPGSAQQRAARGIVVAVFVINHPES